MIAFEFRRIRYHFRALETVHFPEGKSANVLRGALGLLLRETAPPAAYRQIFEPGRQLRKTPSGLADWPRPFVLRSRHLDGQTLEPGAGFFFDLNVFDLQPETVATFQSAFARLETDGIGPRRGRAAIDFTSQLDLSDRVTEGASPPLVATLVPESKPVGRVALHFVTPTELKSGGAVTTRPDFDVLFARLRDRIASLAELYGNGPIDVDFRGIGERARAVRLVRSDIRWESIVRRSSRTGQTHPIGGFTGEAEYEGELAEFLPWLRAGRWTGVGRQTVWGKGEIRVV